MDENEEPGPSTSKLDREKDSHKTNSNTDVEKIDEPGSSETSLSNTPSENSRLDMGHQRPKAPTGKKERRPVERKKRRKPHGRVVKRPRRIEAKRPMGRRSKRIRDNKKKRDLSVSTILTRLSSGVSLVRGCPHCGHGCCRRRFNRMKRGRMQRLRNYYRKAKITFKSMGTQTTESATECIQAGSRCLMLSPLCISTNASPQGLFNQTEGKKACEISPEMIYGALRKLSLWRQEVATSNILDYIKRTYPVGFSEQLLEELAEKLRIAAIVGIVEEKSPGYWCLSCALQKRKITLTHVTLFWKIYADGMKPVVKKPNPPPQSKDRDQESNTEREPDKSILPKVNYTTAYEYL